MSTISMMMQRLLFPLFLLLPSSCWSLHVPYRLPASTSNLFQTSATRVSTNDDDVTLTPPPSPSSSETKNDFSAFDYDSHWYPVSWKRDLPLNKPTKVTIFDVDYVVARTSDDEVMAMLDRCPHKSAALSEGRVTSAGFFQCAYHGWSFDGTDGSCREIPQIVQEHGTKGSAPSSRAFGTAVPAMIHQDMVYLFPGGNLEQALLAPLPPTIPDLVPQQDGKNDWKCVQVVRDFPIDWAILLENIMDPDHGLFAHGTVGFDLYSASKEIPQTLVEETTNDGKGWTATAAVDAEFKLMTLNQKLTGQTPKKNKKEEPVKTGFLTFHAPNFAYYCRRDKETGETTFMTSFYITPTGTGRSRFMSGAHYKAPVSLPRWIVTAQQMNFLDQDTFLLATQQQHVLQYEADAVKHVVNPTTYNTRVRKTHYVYRSPAEKLAVRVGALWDATLTRAPQRVEALHELDIRTTKLRREDILDRASQHLHICPDSQDVVRNCRRLEQWTRRLTTGLVATKAWVTLVVPTSSSRVNAFLSPRLLGTTIVAALVVQRLAQKLRGEYFFKYTNDYHDKDLANIPKVWRDVQ